MLRRVERRSCWAGNAIRSSQLLARHALPKPANSARRAPVFPLFFGQRIIRNWAAELIFFNKK